MKLTPNFVFNRIMKRQPIKLTVHQAQIRAVAGVRVNRKARGEGYCRVGFAGESGTGEIFMTQEERLNELQLCAEIFIRSSTDNGEDFLENYRFTYEELELFLIMFANGAIEQMNITKELEQQLGEKILLRARDSLVVQRERYYPYSADVMAYLYFGIEFLTEHLLGNFKREALKDEK